MLPGQGVHESSLHCPKVRCGLHREGLSEGEDVREDAEELERLKGEGADDSGERERRAACSVRHDLSGRREDCSHKHAAREHCVQ